MQMNNWLNICRNSRWYRCWKLNKLHPPNRVEQLSTKKEKSLILLRLFLFFISISVLFTNINNRSDHNSQNDSSDDTHFYKKEINLLPPYYIEYFLPCKTFYNSAICHCLTLCHHGVTVIGFLSLHMIVL